MTKNPLFLFLVAVAALAACSKEGRITNRPADPVHSDTYLQFSPAGIAAVGNQLQILFSLSGESGQEVITNKKVTLEHIQGEYKTEKIRLEKGTYYLTRFVVLTKSDSAIYAGPKANSPKASLVSQPLAVKVMVTKNGINSIQVQVLRVNETDDPSLFGYDAADFGFLPFISMMAGYKIKVGQVVYDKLPGVMRIVATHSDGRQWNREINMAQGLSQVQVPDNYARYHFEVRKWNTVANKTYNRAELQQGLTILLEAFRNTKRLIEETTFIENSVGLIPDSRTEFSYSGNGRLDEIKNYQRSLQVAGLHLANTYQFIYSGNRLDTIRRKDSSAALTGYTAFMYGDGQITNIANQSYDQFTGAAFGYSQSGGYQVISGDYLFHNGGSMTYVMKYQNGNKTSDQAVSSTGGSESGEYEYDDYINPRHQLGYPDQYFTNSSKNNMLRENKQYNGSIPQAIPYHFGYEYDADGYPREAVISYKGYSSGQHLYRIRKIYRYQ